MCQLARTRDLERSSMYLLPWDAGERLVRDDGMPEVRNNWQTVTQPKLQFDSSEALEHAGNCSSQWKIS